MQNIFQIESPPVFYQTLIENTKLVFHVKRLIDKTVFVLCYYSFCFHFQYLNIDKINACNCTFKYFVDMCLTQKS